MIIVVSIVSSHDGNNSYKTAPSLNGRGRKRKTGLAYSTPCAIMALATLRNPATLAPLT